jgi:hypothetical protein
VHTTWRDLPLRIASNPLSPSSLIKLRKHSRCQSSDANADANQRSQPVGYCRSNLPVCIQQSVPDGPVGSPTLFGNTVYREGVGTIKRERAGARI